MSYNIEEINIGTEEKLHAQTDIDLARYLSTEDFYQHKEEVAQKELNRPVELLHKNKQKPTNHYLVGHNGHDQDSFRFFATDGTVTLIDSYNQLDARHEIEVRKSYNTVIVESPTYMAGLGVRFRLNVHDSSYALGLSAYSSGGRGTLEPTLVEPFLKLLKRYYLAEGS